MALSEERLGQIAVKYLAHQLRKKGLDVNPRELKREVMDGVKTFNVTPVEMAEFLKVAFAVLFEAANRELDAVISGQSR